MRLSNANASCLVVTTPTPAAGFSPFITCEVMYVFRLDARKTCSSFPIRASDGSSLAHNAAGGGPRRRLPAGSAPQGAETPLGHPPAPPRARGTSHEGLRVRVPLDTKRPRNPPVRRLSIRTRKRVYGCAKAGFKSSPPDRPVLGAKLGLLSCS